jgi:hypothetical protein
MPLVLIIMEKTLFLFNQVLFMMNNLSFTMASEEKAGLLI